MSQAPETLPQYLDYAATLDCVHCGLCLPHCPTYQETGREASSPRGRIYLMRAVAEGTRPLDERVLEETYFCLACRACESACPAGVRYGQLVESMRAEIESRGVRTGWAHRLERFALRQVVPRKGAMAALTCLLRLYQRTGLRALITRLGLLKLIPSLAQAEALLPSLPPPHRSPDRVAARGERRGRVAFFKTCVMPLLFGPANAASVFVLAENGFDVEVPREQTCCGALQLHSGDAATAAQLHRKNADAFAATGDAPIITNSAGCGAALKDRPDSLGARSRDITEFLAEVGIREPTRELRLRIAYDDPCHLLHGQGVADAPRELLRAIPGVELIDLPGSRDCCGAAGIYNLTQPEMSQRLLQRKIDAIRELGPDVVASGNPGCLLQLASGVRSAGLDTRVEHPIELLARAYGFAPHHA